MGADDNEPDGKFQFHPWPDLLKRERRELLVDDLIFTTGVTTLVAPSGEGKTTFALSIALSVETGKWGEKVVKSRPVLWIAGEGQDDLRPMFEAWMQLHPGCAPPQGCFMDGPVDLSSDTETDALIKKLDGLPPTLIVTDALADMIGDLDENSSKDVNRVYRNIWRVVRANNGSFLIPHHTGWDTGREKGSTAIRAKSDILVQIIKFDVAAGTVKLKHHKRRGGKKQDLAFQVKLVPVAGYPQPIPIVTGVKLAGGVNLDQPFRRSVNAEAGLTVLHNEFPHGATWAEWFEAWQRRQKAAGNAQSKSSFIRVVRELTTLGEVYKEGDGEGAIYTTVVNQNSGLNQNSNSTVPVSSQVLDIGPGMNDTGSTSAKPVSNQCHDTGSINSGNGQNSVASDNSDEAFEAQIKASVGEGPTADAMRKARAEQKAAKAQELAAKTEARIAEEMKRMKR